MGTKYSGIVEYVYPYGYKIKTTSGDVGVLKKDDMVNSDYNELSIGQKLPVWDNGKRSVKGGILWELSSNSNAGNNNIENSAEDLPQTQTYNRLSCLFINKDRESASNLLTLLLQELTSINSVDSYEFALSLIDINRSYRPLLDKELVHKIYLKANKEIKLKLWRDKVVRYCNFKEVIDKYKNGDTDLVNFLNEEYQFKSICSPSYTAPKLYFNEIERIILEKINNAVSSIKVAVAWFTNPKLLNALIKAIKRGVKVVLITNNDLINNGGYCLRLDDLIDAGGSIHLAEYPDFINHKFAIFDEKCVVNGSYNWTIYAEHLNFENIIIFENESNESLIREFISLFDSMTEKISCVERMPETVPEKPQYDRSSFKQYITEECIFLAKKTRSIEKRDSFYTTALKLTPTHTSIPNSIKVSLGFESEIRQQAIEREVTRLESQRESLDKEFQVSTESEQQLEQKRARISQQPVSTSTNYELENISTRKATEQTRRTKIETKRRNIQSQIEIIKSSGTTELLGNGGKFRINLAWKTTDDLDLHLITPDRQEIYYSNKNVECAGCHGHLDVDANASTPYTSNPQENIFWDDKAPTGEYEIVVELFSYRSNADSIPFVVTIIPEIGEPLVKTQIFENIVAGNKPKITPFKFKYSENKGIVEI